jgi:conjugative transfer signal peptidase TraF
MVKRKKTFWLLITIVAISFWLIKNHFIINVSGSLPRGIYIEKHKTYFERGDIVAVCLPQKLSQFALQRGYLSKGIYCQGRTPLIKKIVACPGDNVWVGNRFIRVNNTIYPIKKFKADSKGRALSAYHSGYYLATGYWLLGTHERSWDSRYFGELNVKHILCVLRPLLIW